jgi:uroporphyrinogen-III synthase
VEVVPAYRTVVPAESAEQARGLFTEGAIDAVTFTSASTVEHFCRLLGGGDIPKLLGGAVVACIGPVTRDAALQRGLPCQVMPQDYTIPALCEALAEHFASIRTRG